jgi:hypothetical protein
MMQQQRRHFERMVPATHTPQETPTRGMFLLSCNNRKRQMGGYESVECEGTLYTSGLVHLDTQALPITEYATLSEMREQLEPYGDCVVTWIGSEVAS